MWKRILGICGAAAAGLAMYQFALPTVMATGWAVAMKVSSRGQLCSWNNTLTFSSKLAKFSTMYQAARNDLHVVERDDAANIEKTASLDYPQLWSQRRGHEEDIRGFGWLLAEHRWLEQNNPADHVAPGDIVFDCGAHVGVFTGTALRRGAAKVVAIEPDPVNVECLRRNFKKEIAEGKVIVQQVGVWNSEGSMKLSLGEGGNTGTNSMWSKQSEKSIEVPVTTIDKLVAKLELSKVTFIKMDIEGAEREALLGAAETLKKHRPRLMLDLNHRPDDAEVLPAVIRQANPAYTLSPGPCQPDEYGKSAIIPHAVYFR
ncbi:MAG: FkbM family methyltransferase [Bryobacteraceae bacterium]